MTSWKGYEDKTGIELLRMIMRGEIPVPSMAETLDFRLILVEEGRAIFEGHPAEYLYNPLGSVHAGYAATMLDSTMGCAVLSLLPAGRVFTTLEFKINMVRPVLANTGPVLAEGKSVHSGSRVATAESKLYGRDDKKLYAHATATCMVVPMIPER